MSNDGDYVERTVTTEAPAPARTEVVHVRGSNAGWWVAAIVAIVAIAGLVFLFTSQSTPTDLQAARDEGAAQATLDNATMSAQQAAADASQAAQSAVEGAARASETAAANAADAADRTAQAAQNAAAGASDAAQDATSPVQ